MKVKELIQQLEELNQEMEIRILLGQGDQAYRIKHINLLDSAFDQDSEELNFYTMDVKTKIEYPVNKETLVIPKSNVQYGEIGKDMR